MSIDYRLIGQRIKEQRKRQNIRQDALAWDSELSATYLSCIENGVKKASLNSLVRIAGALKVSVDFLLFGEKGYIEGVILPELYALLNECEEIEKKFIIDVLLSTATAVKHGLRINGVI